MVAATVHQPSIKTLEKRLNAELRESLRIRRDVRDMEIRHRVQELRIVRAFALRLSSDLSVVRH